MWSNLTAAITTLGLALVISFFLYNSAVQPLLDYDYDSFFNTQTKSVVYTPGILDIDASVEPLTAAVQKQYDPKMFTIEHIIMLPAVDVETINPQRVVTVWDKLTFSTIPATPNTLLAQMSYNMDTRSLYDKSLTFNSLSINPMSLYGSVPVNLNVMVLGAANSSTLLFYAEDKPERQRER